MTAQNLALRHPYTSNGSQVVFDYDNYIWDKSHLRLAVFNASGVAQNDLVVDTDYTVQNVGVAGGGTVTLTTALPSGWKLVILYSYPVEQSFDMTNTIRVFTADHETALDKIVYGMLTLKEQLARAVLVPEDGSVTSTEYLQDVQANRTAAEAAQALAESARDDAEAAWGSISPISAAIATVAGISSAVSTVAGIQAAVSTVAGIQAAVSTVATSNASVVAVATNIANVNTAAANIANINTVAGISANVTTVAGASANVGTVATNIANVNTVATNMASVISAANNIPKANLSASVNPAVGDDNTQGYQPGSLWVNTTAGTVFVCTSAATGAASWGNVGAYNAAAIDATGTFQMSGIISPATFNGTTQHDYSPAGFSTASVVRLTATATTSVTGLGSPAAGRVVLLIAASTNAITLANQNGGSASANQIICPGGVDYIIPASAGVFVIYDSAVSRWRVLSQPNILFGTNAAALAGGNGSTTVPLAVSQGGGRLIKRQKFEVTNRVAVVGTIPVDNTIPQIGEGGQILSGSYTPLRADSLLVVRAIFQYPNDGSNGSTQVSAIFDSAISATDAVRSTQTTSNTTGIHCHTHYLQYEVTSGSTSARTISVRVGGPSMGTNSNGGSAIFNNTMSSFIEVEEFAPLSPTT